MIIIKRNLPTFYEVCCTKCKADILYQLEDLKENQIEETEEINPILEMFKPKYYILNCPCCNEEIKISPFNPFSMGIGGAGR